MTQEQVGNADYLRVTEVACLLGVTEQTIRAWAKDGRIPQPVSWIKNPQYWKKDEVLAYVKQ
jgi:predicted DNA-binding transcriptional regulator AlpA